MSDHSFLEWPFLDADHRRLAVELETWCEAELAPLAHSEQDIDGQCRDLLQRLGAGGWLRHAVPAANGGARNDLDVRSLSIIRETLARYSGLADFVFAMQGLGSGTISLFGSAKQKAAYLPAVASGHAMAAFALTEPKAGSDIANLEMTATADGNGYRLDGVKTFISNGGIADYYVVFARTGEAPGAKGVSAFIVDAATPGLTVTDRIQVMAPHPLATLQFDDCRLPASALLGNPGAGFAQAMATLDIFRTTVGAAALGFSRRALDEATSRASIRAFGTGVLSDNAVTQSKLAEMALDIDTSALLIYRAAWTRDVLGRRNTREAAMAKLHATESAQLTIDKAVQMFGGLGVVHGMPVEVLYREIRALRIYEGASEVQKLVIARQHLSETARPRPGEQR